MHHISIVFISVYSCWLAFCLCSLVFTCSIFVYSTCVHLCLLVFYACSLAFYSCSIHTWIVFTLVLLVITREHLCSTCVYTFSPVFIRVQPVCYFSIDLLRGSIYFLNSYTIIFKKIKTFSNKENAYFW